MSWQALKENWAQLGWMGGSIYSFDIALRRVTDNRARIIQYLFVAQPVPANQSATSRQSQVTQVRKVHRSDPVVALFPRPREVIARRFDSGGTCYVAEVRGEFAGFIWLAFGDYEEDEVRCSYELASPNYCAWDYDIYVEPKYRMGRTFARLWDAANQELAQRGIRWSCSRISSFNKGSVSSHSRLGIRRLFVATFLCIGPIQFALIGAPPFLHFSPGGRSRPVLKLRIPPAWQEPRNR